jgi:hypothetical protein
MKTGKDPAIRKANAPDRAQKTTGDEINEFLRDLAEKKKRREFQLAMVKEFFEDPLKFGVKADAVPTSATPDEIRKRIVDLEYRRDLLQFVLESTEAELALLNVAESETRPDDDVNKKASEAD